MSSPGVPHQLHRCTPTRKRHLSHPTQSSNEIQPMYPFHFQERPPGLPVLRPAPDFARTNSYVYSHRRRASRSYLSFNDAVLPNIYSSIQRYVSSYISHFSSIDYSVFQLENRHSSSSPFSLFDSFPSCLADPTSVVSTCSVMDTYQCHHDALSCLRRAASYPCTN